MTSANTNQRSGYRPPDLIVTAPLFSWPLRPFRIMQWFFAYPGYLWPWTALFAILAAVCWMFFTPSVPTIMNAKWLLGLYWRNAVLITLFVGVWHLRLYVARAQGAEYKYNARWLSAGNPTFLFKNQLWDNVCWTLLSAVPIWTTYEAVTLWAQSKGLIPSVSWKAHPIYCSSLLLLIPVFQEAHFYFIHRLIHWPPLYRVVHSLHHKNVNTGPWSGLAMHPIEHLFYFSTVLLHWLVPSHPLHVVFHLQYTALAPTLSHCGFHRLVLGKRIVAIDQYMHYLHHQYFEVNYGGDLAPLDKLFGTFHDGSPEAQEAMKNRLRLRRNRWQ